MPSIWPRKDPDEVLDYSVDWTNRLDSDDIDTVVWTVPAGLTSVNETNTTKIATIWLSGGAGSVTYELNCRVTTLGSRVFDQTCYLTVASR
jgi:hypothetical protein